MTLASSADVEARLGRDLTDVEQPRAAGLLEIPDDLWPILGQSVTAESFTIEP